MTYTGKKLWYHDVLIEELQVLREVLMKNEVPFWIDFGTLLGAYRDGKMIPWDYDTDVSVWIDDAEKMLAAVQAMKSKGFDTRGDRNAKHLRVVRFFKDDFDFHVDIFPWFVDSDNDGMVRAAVKHSIWRHPLELKNFVDIEFEGVMYPSPENPKPFFERFYGATWREPKVLSGNAVWIKNHDPTNQDIIDEIHKYGGY